MSSHEPWLSMCCVPKSYMGDVHVIRRRVAGYRHSCTRAPSLSLSAHPCQRVGRRAVPQSPAFLSPTSTTSQELDMSVSSPSSPSLVLLSVQSLTAGPSCPSLSHGALLLGRKSSVSSPSFVHYPHSPSPPVHSLLLHLTAPDNHTLTPESPPRRYPLSSSTTHFPFGPTSTLSPFSRCTLSLRTLTMSRSVIGLLSPSLITDAVL